MLNTTTTPMKIALSVGLSAASLLAQAVNAESSIVFGGPGSFSTSARLDFEILSPRFLRFQVGTVGVAIDLISFDMTSVAVNLGNSVAQGGTGGNLGAGAVTVSIKANSGQVTITPSNNSGGVGLGNGVVGQNIAYTAILTASSAVTLPAPTLSNAGGAAAMPAISAGTVTDQAAIWTYTYANTTVPSAGTYGAGGAGTGGRVTYTASSP